MIYKLMLKRFIIHLTVWNVRAPVVYACTCLFMKRLFLTVSAQILSHELLMDLKNLERHNIKAILKSIHPVSVTTYALQGHGMPHPLPSLHLAILKLQCNYFIKAVPRYFGNNLKEK